MLDDDAEEANEEADEEEQSVGFGDDGDNYEDVIDDSDALSNEYDEFQGD